MAPTDVTTDAGPAPLDPPGSSTPTSTDTPGGRRARFSAVGTLAGSNRTMFGVVVVAAIGWAIVLGRLVVLRHERFGTFDFDSGIQDQLIWGVAHGHWFTTVRGVPFFGNHASFSFLILAPFTWLGAGPNTWNVLNAVALAACAPILYLIARDRIGRPWIAAAVGIVWLAQPSVQWWVQEGFHPECVALPFLFATWLFGERIAAHLAADTEIPRRSWWWFGASFFATIIWKEDVALALAGMGLVWLIRRRFRLGVPVVAIASLWFVSFGAIMVPKAAGGTVYGGIYGDLGDTPTQVVTNSVRHPSRLVRRLGENDALAYSSRLNQGFGYVTLASPVTWLIGAPQWFVDVSSTAEFTRSDRFHYQALPLAALAISFVEGVWFLLRRRRWLGHGAVLLGLGAAVWVGWQHSPGPWTPEHYRAGYWPLEEPVNQAANEAAIALIGPDDGVSADYLKIPHLTHRRYAYTFPNPWLNSNYGIDPEDRGDPAAVDWIIMDTTLLSDPDRAFYDTVKASGEFELVLARDDVEVLRRVRPPDTGEVRIPRH